MAMLANFVAIFITIGPILCTASIHGNQPTVAQNQCHRTAVLNLVMAALYKRENIHYDNFYAEARTNLIETDEEGCKRKSNRLEIFVKLEMARQRIPQILIDDCSTETIPYNLLLCKVDWPNDILAQLRPEFCKSSCSRIDLWDEYHRMRGVNEFPEGWKGQLALVEDFKVKKNVAHTPSHYGTFEYARNFGDGVDMEDLQRPKRQHGVTPIPMRFVKEFFHTNGFGIGNWTRQAKCLDNEWPFAVADGLPFNITIYCWGRNGFGGSHTVGVYDNSTKSKPMQLDCNKQVQFQPPNGSFLIGMSNRVNYNTTNILVAGVFLCSGEEKWTDVKNSSVYNTTNGTGEIARCAPGTIMCTIELKMASVGNQTFATDVRVGCCEAPAELFYSSLTVVPFVLLNKDGHSLDNSYLDINLDFSKYPRFFKNSTIPKDNFQRDYYADPYGGFLNSIEIHDPISIHDFNYGLSFAYSRFDDTRTTIWEDQNPIFLEYEATDHKSCAVGFVNAVRVRGCNDSDSNGYPIKIVLNCSSGGIIENNNAACQYEPQSFKGECPKKHLICGIRRFFAAGSKRVGWAGYRYTYICCPVVHTARSICRPNGAILNVVPAKVNCIAISGADTECTTTQRYGYTMEKATTTGATIDSTTEETYGYSTADKLEVAASASATVSASAKGKGGIPLVGEVEVEAKVEATVSSSVASTSEDVQTNSNTNRVSEAFSFSEASKTAVSKETETTTKFTILDGQRALFYDVRKTCGAINLMSEDFIRILTPSLKCDAHIAFEYIFGWRYPVQPWGFRNFTFYGYGLEIENDTFVHPLERGVNWDLISLGVKEKFTDSAALSDDNDLTHSGYDFKRAQPGIWQRSSLSVKYNYTINIIGGHNYRFYRLVGRCGRWRVNTESIWTQHEQYGIFNSTKQDPSPNIELVKGTTFRLVRD